MTSTKNTAFSRLFPLLRELLKTFRRAVGGSSALWATGDLNQSEGCHCPSIVEGRWSSVVILIKPYKQNPRRVMGRKQANDALENQG